MWTAAESRGFGSRDVCGTRPSRARGAASGCPPGSLDPGTNTTKASPPRPSEAGETRAPRNRCDFCGVSFFTAAHLPLPGLLRVRNSRTSCVPHAPCSPGARTQGKQERSEL